MDNIPASYKQSLICGHNIIQICDQIFCKSPHCGPNIIEQTIRQKLPPGFQRSEFLLSHGAIDMIVRRADMRDTPHRVLGNLTHYQN